LESTTREHQKVVITPGSRKQGEQKVGAKQERGIWEKKIGQDEELPKKKFAVRAEKKVWV